eukprot:5743324-Amphidinium_carterae.1
MFKCSTAVADVLFTGRGDASGQPVQDSATGRQTPLRCLDAASARAALKCAPGRCSGSRRRARALRSS